MDQEKHRLLKKSLNITGFKIAFILIRSGFSVIATNKHFRPI